MLGKGKKTKAWERSRQKLKKEFLEKGITTCEIRMYGCFNDNFLGFAHIDKRRFLTDEELMKVVLACQPCHDIVERWPREKMREFLENIIKNR